MHLFSPYTTRGITLRNRIAVSPMCQYSSENGLANDWHKVHLGSRAVGGAGLVFTEAAAVTEGGRISPRDLGIYDDAHIAPLREITDFLEAHGAASGIQIAHAGRKASTAPPWEGGGPLTPDEGGWRPIVAPSNLAFDIGHIIPQELSEDEIAELVQAFGAATRRAQQAGFKVLEIHAAHGYLLHEFLSPLSNLREDRYGGSFDNRIRIVLEVVEEVRRNWPDYHPLWVRFSVTDWKEGGWDIEEAIELARRIKPLGVDLIDCSSGGTAPDAVIPMGAGYQTAFANRIRHEADIPTGAVGLITSPMQADHIIRTEQADIVLLAREMLRNPYWPCMAAVEVHQPSPVPVQYARAW